MSKIERLKSKKVLTQDELTRVCVACFIFTCTPRIQQETTRDLHKSAINDYKAKVDSLLIFSISNAFNLERVCRNVNVWLYSVCAPLNRKGM